MTFPLRAPAARQPDLRPVSPTATLKLPQQYAADQLSCRSLRCRAAPGYLAASSFMRLIVPRDWRCQRRQASGPSAKPDGTSNAASSATNG